MSGAPLGQLGEVVRALPLLTRGELDPAALGALFESTMTDGDRRRLGAHYTPEAAIWEHVVGPSLIEPWSARIKAAEGAEALGSLHATLVAMRILDPACGGGMFLYVAYRALVRLEIALLKKLHKEIPEGSRVEWPSTRAVSVTQLFGIDIDPLALEVARLTLLAGAELARRERHSELGSSVDEAPPVDSSLDLDTNLRVGDALFCEWPPADLIIGNPPFQSKNRMQRAFGPAYVRRLRERYPLVPGRADYCVYWFYRAHMELGASGRAGLVGTNTIRQNESREGGLDVITQGGGLITEAVSSMVWPGEAVVHVSIVNWIKGEQGGPKKLSWQEGDAIKSPWRRAALDHIPASLSASVDVASAKALRANAGSGACYQGLTHGHEGFLIPAPEARAVLSRDPTYAEVLFPYLTGDDLLGDAMGEPSRWVIDFGARGLSEARRYAELFERVEARVFPDRVKAADDERARNEALFAAGERRANRHHELFLRRYWLLSYPRGELIQRLRSISRYIACSRVMKRPIFEFVESRVRPSDALLVFALDDDYSFGVLQSDLHWEWLKARCSTLKGDYRYTSSTVFASFPWPQSLNEGGGAELALKVAEAAVEVRRVRRAWMERRSMGLRALYAGLDEPDRGPLRDAHAALDEAVRAAYGAGPREDALAFLLELNRACAEREAKGERIQGPDPSASAAMRALITDDTTEPAVRNIQGPGGTADPHR